ncbi:MAG TPA: rhomboid family intramembrane serine protease, partial [Rhizomicrobium sp.]|nr:rhomboid family intramembrane serine protease [Rhizomicrobium sp.]
MAFLQEPQRPYQPILRAPAVVIWLLVTIIAAHAARIYLGNNVSGAIFYEFGFIPARYSAHFLTVHHLNPGSLPERIVPFFSYVFLHGDFAHLAVNCLWLLAFAPIVARRFGAGLFLVFFFVCAAAAAAAHLAFNWESVDPVIGASGAISGLMAAGMRIYTARPEGERSAKLAPIFSGQILSFTILWSVINVVAGITGIGAGA